MKPTSQKSLEQEDPRLRIPCRRPDELFPTALPPRARPQGTHFSCLVLLVLGLAAGACLSGCTVTYVEPPPGTVVAPAPIAEEPPVVVEETAYVDFAPPMVDVDYYFIGGRYAYWHPTYHRWFYRPEAWRPPASVHFKRAANLRELNDYHRPVSPPRSEARPQQKSVAPTPRPQPGRTEEKRPEIQKKSAEPAPKPQPARTEERKTEVQKKSAGPAPQPQPARTDERKTEVQKKAGGPAPHAEPAKKEEKKKE